MPHPSDCACRACDLLATVLTLPIPASPPFRRYDPPRVRRAPTVEELPGLIYRWWEQIDQPCDGSGHWLWAGSLNADGYGYFSTFNTAMAHRFGFWLRYRYLPIRGVSEVAHDCGVRRCVNPDHLLDQTHWRNCQERSRH